MRAGCVSILAQARAASVVGARRLHRGLGGRGLRVECVKIFGCDVARDVAAVEARAVEGLDRWVHVAEHLVEVLDGRVDHGVGAEDLRDLLGALAVAAEQFGARRHVDAVDVREHDARGGRGHEDLDGAGLAGHAHDFGHGRAAHDGVVDEQDALALELDGHGVELLAHALLADRLAGHDEGTAHVAVLDEAFAIRQSEHLGELLGARAGAVGNRHHDVDVLEVDGLPHVVGEDLAQTQAGGVDVDAVDRGVGTGEVDELEGAGMKRGLVGAL